MMKIYIPITLDLQRSGIPPHVEAKQNDRDARGVIISLYDGGVKWNVPAGALALFRFKKPDGTAGWYDKLEDGKTPAITVTENTVTAIFAEQVLTAPGDVFCEINFYNSTGEKLTTFSWIVQVLASALSDAEIVSSNYYNVLSDQIAAVLKAESAADTSAKAAASSANAAKGSETIATQKAKEAAASAASAADSVAATKAHISDAVRHITASERTRWSDTYTQSETAARDKAVQDDLNALKTRRDNPHTVTKAQVGLGNADNTSDENKPVSTAQASAIKTVQDDVTAHKGRADNPHAVTKAQIGLANATNESKATMFASPTFTGTVTLPVAAPTADTQAAHKGYVDKKIADLVSSAPGTLDTLNELAAALGDDPSFAATMAAQLGGKVDKIAGKGLSANDYDAAEKAANADNTAARHTHGNKALLDTYTQTEANLKSAADQRHSHANKSVLDGLTAALVTEWNSAVTHIADAVKHITAAERTLWNTVSGKVDKVTGKGLSTQDYTSAEKTKLAGVAAGANNYVLPLVQAGGTSTTAVMSQKAVTDAIIGAGGGDMMKSVYDPNGNGKVTLAENSEKVNNLTVLTAVPANAKFTDTTYSNATTTANGLMVAADKTKLDGIAKNANNYVLPITHTIGMSVTSVMSQNGVKLGLESYGINLYEHSEFRNEHALDGVGANGKAFISEFVDNLVKTILVNGIAYTPLYNDGYTRLTEFPIGSWVTFTQDASLKKIIFNLSAPQGVKMELIWKNVSPNSNFPAQTVSLSLYNYTHVGISAKWAPAANQTDDGVKIYRIDSVPKSIDSQAAGVASESGRGFDLTSTGVKFKQAYVRGVFQDGYIIPLEIYGIRGVSV